MVQTFLLFLLALFSPEGVIEQAEAYFDKNDFRQTASVIEEALPALREAGDEVALADCLSLLSISYTRLGAFSSALEAQQECYELDLKSGDPGNISSSLNNLAGILLSMEKYEEAERLIREAISYEEQLGESAALAIRYGMASDILLKRGKAEEAMEYATRALDIDTRAGRTQQIAMRQSQLAEAYLETGRLQEAGELLDRAAAVFSASGNLHSLSVCKQQQGKVAARRGNFRAAAQALREGLTLSQQTGNLLLQRNISQDLAAVLEDSDPRTAIKYMQDVVALSDSLYQQQAAQKIAELTIRNDLAGKEREIENQQRLLRSRRHLIEALGALFIMLVAALVLVVRALHLRNRSNYMLSEAARIKDQLLILGGKDDGANSEEMSQLAEALDRLGAGTPDTALTAREREIAQLCCKGLLNKEIADRLSISQRTVETHKHNIFRKLGINTTIELVRLMNSRKRL